MASTKQNEPPKAINTQDIQRAQGLSQSHSKIESYRCGGLEENDQNSVLSPSKSADPARKKTFKIINISVKKGGAGSGDVAADNDADSIDGLDESQTEDLSSEFYDSSKATDLDIDIQDGINLPLTPDEVTSTTTIVVKQKPDRDSQSRFKVVKIETKEPFRRGKWVCYDFFDTAPAAVVTLEKNGSKVTEDSIIHSALSGNLSSSSSVHYVQDVNDSSSNIFVTPVVPLSPTGLDSKPFLSDVFVPIQPAPASQILNQDGLSSDVMAPFIAQQLLISVGGVPSSSTSFHNLAQPGHTTIVQSLPHTNLFPYAQNGPPATLFLNGVTAGQSSHGVNLTADATLTVCGSGTPAFVATPTSATEENCAHNQTFVIIGGVPVPCSQSQTLINTGTISSQIVTSILDGSTAAGPSVPSIPPVIGHISQSRVEDSGETGDKMGPGMDESTGSIKTLQGDADGQTPQGLEEAVETMYIGLEGHEDADDDRDDDPASVLPKTFNARPVVRPSHLEYRSLESPCSLCHTPVRSLCASPVPASFLDHYDPVISLATRIFPASVASPPIPAFVPFSTAGVMNSMFTSNAIPISTSGFPQSEPYLHTTYFPYLNPPLSRTLSPVSAFTPFTSLNMTGVSCAQPVAFSINRPLVTPATSFNSTTGTAAYSSPQTLPMSDMPTSLFSPLPYMAPAQPDIGTINSNDYSSPIPGLELPTSMSRPASPSFLSLSSAVPGNTFGQSQYQTRVVRSEKMLLVDSKQNVANMPEIFDEPTPYQTDKLSPKGYVFCMHKMHLPFFLYGIFFLNPNPGAVIG